MRITIARSVSGFLKTPEQSEQKRVKITTLNDHYAIAPSSLQKRVQTDKRVLTEIYSPWYLSCLYFSSAAATYRLIF